MVFFLSPNSPTALVHIPLSLSWTPTHCNVALNTTVSSASPHVATVFTMSFEMGGLLRTGALELGMSVASSSLQLGIMLERCSKSFFFV